MRATMGWFPGTFGTPVHVGDWFKKRGTTAPQIVAAPTEDEVRAQRVVREAERLFEVVRATRSREKILFAAAELQTAFDALCQTHNIWRSNILGAQANIRARAGDLRFPWSR